MGRWSAKLQTHPQNAPGDQKPRRTMRVFVLGRGVTGDPAKRSSGPLLHLEEFAPRPTPVEPTASLRVSAVFKKKTGVCVRMNQSDILRISLVHTVDSVYGCALQDGVLPTGGKQNRVGSSREVPGPEADWNRSIWHRVVSQGGKKQSNIIIYV